MKRLAGQPLPTVMVTVHVRILRLAGNYEEFPHHIRIGPLSLEDIVGTQIDSTNTALFGSGKALVKNFFLTCCGKLMSMCKLILNFGDTVVYFELVLGLVLIPLLAPVAMNRVRAR